MAVWTVQAKHGRIKVHIKWLGSIILVSKNIKFIIWHLKTVKKKIHIACDDCLSLNKSYGKERKKKKQRMYQKTWIYLKT